MASTWCRLPCLFPQHFLNLFLQRVPSMALPGDFLDDDVAITSLSDGKVGDIFSSAAEAAAVADVLSAEDGPAPARRRRLDGGGAAPGASVQASAGSWRRSRRQRVADRRMANRAHAKASRERAKAHLAGLEARVAELEAAHSALIARCSELEHENAVLRGDTAVSSTAPRGGGEFAAVAAAAASTASHAVPRVLRAESERENDASGAFKDEDRTYEALHAGLDATLAQLYSQPITSAAAGATAGPFGPASTTTTTAETSTTTHVYTRKSAVLAIIISYSISLLLWGETMRWSTTSPHSPRTCSPASEADRRRAEHLRRVVREALAKLPEDLRSKVAVVLAAVRRLVKAEESLSQWRAASQSNHCGGQRFEAGLGGRGNALCAAPAC